MSSVGRRPRASFLIGWVWSRGGVTQTVNTSTQPMRRSVVSCWALPGQRLNANCSVSMHAWVRWRHRTPTPPCFAPSPRMDGCYHISINSVCKLESSQSPQVPPQRQSYSPGGVTIFALPAVLLCPL